MFTATPGESKAFWGSPHCSVGFADKYIDFGEADIPLGVLKAHRLTL